MTSVACIAAFWCACAVKDTVGAVLWAGPAVGALAIAGSLGVRLAQPGNLAFLVSTFHPFPFSAATERLVSGIALGPFNVLIDVPAVVFAIIQSRRLFRKEAQAGALSVVRYLAPLVAVYFLCSFLAALSYFFTFEAHGQARMVLLETHAAIGRMQLDPASLAASPRQVTFEEIARIFSSIGSRPQVARELRYHCRS